MKRWMVMLAIGGMLTCGVSATRACPMCKDSISDTAHSGNVDGRGQQDGLPGGFNTSVYIMLGGFLGTTGLMAFIVTRGILGANAAHTRNGLPLKSGDPET